MLTKAQKRRWLKDLRSGELPQGTRMLQNGNGYCCIGVLKKGLVGRDLTWKEKQQLGVAHNLLPASIQGRLVLLNDIKKWGFNKIADWIEVNVKAV